MEDTFTGADFAEASGGDSSPAGESVDTGATVGDTAQPEAATIAPAVEATSQTPSTEKPARPAGPIPFEAHKTALDNARTKATEEWDAQYGWAKQVDRQAVEQAVELSRLYTTDRAGYVRTLLAEAIADPQLAPAIRSEAARLLGSRPQAEAQQEPQPDIPVQLEDGRVIHLYSTQQQAKRDAFLQQRMLAQVEERYAPIVQTVTQQREAHESAAREAQATQFATGFFGELQKLPGFTEHKGEIAKALGAMRLQSDHPAEVRAAALQLYTTLVLPKLHTSARQSVLTDITAQAAASTINPARTSAAPAKGWDEMSTAEALQHVASQQG